MRDPVPDRFCKPVSCWLSYLGDSVDTPEPQAMSVWQILGRSVEIYGNNFLRFIAVVALVHIPWLLIRLLLSPPMSLKAQEELDSGFPWLLMLLAVLGLLVSLIVNAAIFKSVSDLYTQSKIIFSQTYKCVWTRLGAILTAALILMALYACVIVLPMMGLFFNHLIFVIADSLWPLYIPVIFLGTVASLIVLVLVATWFAVTVQCIMAKNLSAWQSLKRSKRLVKGNMGRVFVLIIILLAISIVAHWPFRYVGGIIGGVLIQLHPAVVPLMKNTLSMVGSILIAPITAISMALLYYDLLARKESQHKMQVAAEVEKAKPWWDTWPKQWRQE